MNSDIHGSAFWIGRGQWNIQLRMGNFFCIWLGLDLQIHIWILTQRQQLKTMDCTLYFSSYDKMKNGISILFLSLYDTIYIWIEKRIYINILYCWCSCIKKILLNLSTCFSISVVNAFVASSQIVMRCLFNDLQNLLPNNVKPITQ